MGFDQNWEKSYANNTQLSIWPWSDIVSLVNRYCKSLIMRGGGRVLELGCGAGANIPFFQSIGMDYYAIEGSPTIVRSLHDRYPELADKINIGDFTKELPFTSSFDLVIDRASLTHNTTASIRKALDMTFNIINDDGVFIGSDWFSNSYTDFQWGEQSDDEFTKTFNTKGYFVGLGNVHFSDELHLRDLFSKFDVIFMEEKLYIRHEPKDNHQLASWNIVARKR